MYCRGPDPPSGWDSEAEGTDWCGVAAVVLFVTLTLVFLTVWGIENFG